jgi:hypothetical protein
VLDDARDVCPETGVAIQEGLIVIDYPIVGRDFEAKKKTYKKYLKY